MADTNNAATAAQVDAIIMLPCPFCGGRPERHHHWSEGKGTFHSISCRQCHAVTGGDIEQHWNHRDWNGMTKQYSTVGFLQGILMGIRIGIDDERARIIDAALSDERYFGT